MGIAAHRQDATARGPSSPVDKPKCERCQILLTPEEIARGGSCFDCQRIVANQRHAARTKPQVVVPSPRDFTPAEKALIRSMHGYTSATKLLELLNTRLAFDLGSKAVPYTMEQLHEELRRYEQYKPADSWANLRQLLAKARRAGVLETISAQIIDDFSVVFSLSPAQSMRLKDVILEANTASREGARA